VIARSRTTRSILLSLAVFGLACTDAPTGTSEGGEQRLVVSVAGVSSGDGGIVLRLSGAVQSIEPARQSLDLAWFTDAAGSTTVAVIGTIDQSSDLVVVRRRVEPQPLRAEVIEVATADGELSVAEATRLTIRRLPGT
jgi:hypothetical protein